MSVQIEMENHQFEGCQGEDTDVRSPTIRGEISFSDWPLEEDLLLLNAMEKCGTDDWVPISQCLKDRTPLECKLHYIYYFVLFPRVPELDYSEILRTNGNKHLYYNSKQDVISSDSFIHEDQKSQLLINTVTSNECGEDSEVCISKTDNVIPFSTADKYGFLPEKNVCKFNEKLIEQPLHFCMKLDVTEPPRILNNSLMAGYNPFRSDFRTEYDNNAEDVLSLLNCDYQNNIYDFYDSSVNVDGTKSSENDDDDDNDADLIKELSVKIVEGYNLRLEERKKRKQIIRNYGLINPRKIIVYQSRLEAMLGRENYKSIIHCMQVMNTFEFDKLMESLQYSFILRGHVCTLLNYRKEGLRTKHSIKTYEKLKKNRDESLDTTRRKISLSLLSPLDMAPRRKAAPLIIHHLPGFKQLNESEVTLCSSNRILPNLYLKFKNLLITECEKSGGLKLSQARSLLKIDVNKTRKIYDHLIDAGLIWTS